MPGLVPGIHVLNPSKQASRGWGGAAGDSPRPSRAVGNWRYRSNHPASLVPRLQIALAVIAALRTPRRTVAIGLGFVARARFVAAGAMHQHAAALAVGDQAALAGGLERLLAAR